MSHTTAIAKRKADSDLDTSDVAAPKRQALRPFAAGLHTVAAVMDDQEHKKAAEPDAAAAGTSSASSIRQPDVSLQLVFGWLDLADLNRALSASKQWRSNVCAMPSIGSTVKTDDGRHPLCAVYASPLAHHVATLHRESQFTSASAADLALVTARMPALRTLNIGLVMPPVAVGPGLLVFPQRLTQLSLSLDWPHAAAHTPHELLVQRVIEGIGALTSLEELTLEAQVTGTAQRAAVSFEPLRSLYRLRCLNFSWLGPRSVEQQTLSAAQLDCVRYLANSHALFSLSLFDGMLDCLLTDMTVRNETGPLLVHHLGLQHSKLTAAHVSIMRCFPALRTFESYRIERLNFLPRMPHLHTCNVSLTKGAAVSDDQLVDAITPLTQLTDLSINNHPTLSEEHLTRLLASLPLIRSLDLCSLPQLRSLAFLASGPITHSLTSFTLWYCRHADLRTVELRQLHPCKLLTSLRLYFSFSNELSDADRRFYEQRPCSALPALVDFSYFAP